MDLLVTLIRAAVHLLRSFSYLTPYTRTGAFVRKARGAQSRREIMRSKFYQIKRFIMINICLRLFISRLQFYYFYV